MTFHYINFRTYSHATENEKSVEEALRFVSGTDKIEKRTAEGYHGNPIIIMEAKLKKSREAKVFFSGLKQQGLVGKILDELEDRIDEDCSFYLRFDKQKAFDKKYELVKHDDIILVKGKIKCFPPGKGSAVKSMKDFLENL
ncbi:MAG: RNA-binding domain-containing protein [Thermoplasmatales archaeon]|nr:RNA-binding domain-containing protein [Thermoplasmatales archaeon]